MRESLSYKDFWQEIPPAASRQEMGKPLVANCNVPDMGRMVAESNGMEKLSEPTKLSLETRKGLRRFAKSVMVITARQGERRFAMSATAVSEVSLDPPTLLVCVNQTSAFHSSLVPGAEFAMSILHAGQEQIARNCGGELRGEDRFDQGQWNETDAGTPWLSDAQASFICKLVRQIDHGTHSVFIGEVQHVYVNDPVDPLVYVDGRYVAPLRKD